MFYAKRIVAHIKQMVNVSSQSLTARLEALAASAPNEPALHYHGQPVTYGQFLERTRKLASGFAALGTDRGDRVGIWMPNNPDWLVTFFALSRLGAVAVSGNPRYRSREISDIFKRANIKSIVYCPEMDGLHYTEILKDALTDIKSVKNVVYLKNGDDEKAPVFEGLQSIPFAKLASFPPMQEVRGTSGDPCLILNSSGTTKRPKLIVHRQDSLLRHAISVGDRAGYSRSGTVTLQALPLCGTFGFTQSMAALLNKCPNVVQSKFDADEAVSLCAAGKVTLMAATDVMVERMCNALQPGMTLSKTLFLVGTRASELRPIVDRHRLRMASIYGSSEVHALFSCRTEGEEDHLVGGGHPVSADAHVRIRDSETGKLLPHGETGEIEIKSANLFIEYDGDEQATRETRTEDGFFVTGDLGYSSADGSFTYLTRLGDAASW